MILIEHMHSYMYYPIQPAVAVYTLDQIISTIINIILCDLASSFLQARMCTGMSCLT